VEVGAAINLTKDVVILDEGTWTLADGVEGQIIYFVSATGIELSKVEVSVSHLRRQSGAHSTASAAIWLPFKAAGSNVPILTVAIFTQGAWNVSSGALN
jgi:hypothetical protein